MKKLLLFLIVSISMFAVETFTDYQAGLKEAKESNKALFVVVEQDHCPWCKKFRGTLNNPEVRKVLDEQFVLVILNKDHNPPPKKFKVPLTPVSFIVENSEEILFEIIGYAPPEKVLMDIELSFEEL